MRTQRFQGSETIGPCWHKLRGAAYYSEQCQRLQARNPDPSSLFVEFDGEISEVTKALVRWPYDAIEEGQRMTQELVDTMSHEEIPEWLPQDSRVANIYLRHGPLTAGQAAALLKMSTTACWNQLNRLLEANFLEQVGLFRIPGRRGGRPLAHFDVKGRTSHS